MVTLLAERDRSEWPILSRWARSSPRETWWMGATRTKPSRLLVPGGGEPGRASDKTRSTQASERSHPVPGLVDRAPNQYRGRILVGPNVHNMPLAAVLCRVCCGFSSQRTTPTQYSH